MANIRQQIVDAIAASMKTISTSNGYSSTIKTVDVWLIRSLEESNLPAIVIRDTSDALPDDGIGAGRRDHELTIFLVAQFAGTSSLSQCRDLMSDMLAAIGTDPTLGGLAYDCSPLNTELIADEANKKVGFGQLILNVSYRSQLWQM